VGVEKRRVSDGERSFKGGKWGEKEEPLVKEKNLKS